LNIEDLKELPSVRKWLKKRHNSKGKWNQVLNVLNRFLEETELDPEKIVEKWKKVRFGYREKQKFILELEEQIEDYHDNNLENCVPNARFTHTFTIIGFFRAHKIDIQPELSGLKERGLVTYHNRSIQKEEVKRILEHSSLREKLFFTMMTETGARPDTLVQLRYKHIKEEFEAKKIPMKITLYAHMVKDMVGDRFTFLGEDGYKLLEEYLEPRQPLSDEDLIFAPEKTTMKGEYLNPAGFSNVFGDIVRKLALVDKSKLKHGKPAPLRLYCLRKYFRNNLKIDPSIREFLMGHSLKVDGHYIGRDIEVDAELYRELYKQAYSDLRIFAPRNIETNEKVDELMKLLTAKDTEVKDLKKRVDLLTQIVARAVNKEDMEALRETWGAFLTDILMQMEGKEVPKRPKVTKGIKEELREEA